LVLVELLIQEPEVLTVLHQFLIPLHPQVAAVVVSVGKVQEHLLMGMLVDLVAEGEYHKHHQKV
jgi:hypothetical protein